MCFTDNHPKNDLVYLQDTKCACLDNLSSLEKPVDPKLCNITCEGTYCGGKDVINIYVTGKEQNLFI